MVVQPCEYTTNMGLHMLKSKFLICELHLNTPVTSKKGRKERRKENKDIMNCAKPNLCWFRSPSASMMSGICIY